VEAFSGVGSVEVDGLLAGLAATSSAGNVTVTAQPGSKVAVPWTLESGYGGVTLELPPGFSCELSAATGVGSIHSDFPVELDTGALSGKQVKGVIGQGGGEVSVKTASGAIRVVSSTAEDPL
jgi:hypothetical protein